jgi:molecular chaperone DnaK (HSP70)
MPPQVYAIDFGTSNSLLAAADRDRVYDPIPLDPSAPNPTIFRSVLQFGAEKLYALSAFHSVIQGLAHRARAMEAHPT